MSRLILFSGGVESTALLTLASPEDVLLTIDPAYPHDLKSYRKDTAQQIARYFGLRMQYARATIPIEPSPQRFVHQMRTFISLCNLWVAKDESVIAVWCGRNSAEPGPRLKPFIDQMMAAWDKLHPDVPFLHPLTHLSKREQWNLIPPKVRPLVSSCINHRMCGTCHKCLEWTCLSESSLPTT